MAHVHICILVVRNTLMEEWVKSILLCIWPCVWRYIEKHPKERKQWVKSHFDYSHMTMLLPTTPYIANALCSNSCSSICPTGDRICSIYKCRIHQWISILMYYTQNTQKRMHCDIGLRWPKSSCLSPPADLVMCTWRLPLTKCNANGHQTATTVDSQQLMCSSACTW